MWWAWVDWKCKTWNCRTRKQKQVGLVRKEMSAWQTRQPVAIRVLNDYRIKNVKEIFSKSQHSTVFSSEIRTITKRYSLLLSVFMSCNFMSCIVQSCIFSARKDNWYKARRLTHIYENTKNSSRWANFLNYAVISAAVIERRVVGWMDRGGLSRRRLDIPTTLGVVVGAQ